MKEKEITFTELLELTGLNARQFALTYNIPARTCQNWQSNNSMPPSYVLELLEYRIKTEKKTEDMKMKRIASIRENDEIDGALVYFEMNTDTFKLSSSNGEEVTGGNIPSSEKEACNVLFQQWGYWQTFEWLDSNSQPSSGKMKKFELKKNGIEINKKDARLIQSGCTIDQNETFPTLITPFYSKEDALEALKSYHTEIRDLDSYYLVEEFYVEENEYDEDGEWLDGGDIWAFTDPIIEISEKPSCNTVGTFNNMAAALDCLNSLEDGFISFK